MGKRKLIILISSVISVTLLSGLVLTTISLAGDKKTEDISTSPINIDTGNDTDTGDSTYIPPTPEDNSGTSVNEAGPTPTEEPFVPATEVDLDITSITVFVNKEHALPKDYRPEGMVVANVRFDLPYYDERKLMRPEAAAALEELFAEADKEGVTLYGVSAYRSYERQKQIFLNNIVKKGKTHTLQYSAVPGTSEHQTGLAIDLSSKELHYKLDTSFENSPEGIWLKDNSYRFGYIIRYPKEKEDITGYAYEPWHIRYVGKPLAKYLYQNDMTLDEYYHYTPSPGFNFESLYADFINYVPPKVTIIPPDGTVVDDGGLSEDGLGEETADGTDTGKGSDGTDTSTDNDSDDGSSTDNGATDGNTLPGESGGTDTGSQDGNSDGTTTEDGSNQAGDGTGSEVTPTVTPTPSPTITPALTPTATPTPPIAQ